MLRMGTASYRDYLDNREMDAIELKKRYRRKQNETGSLMPSILRFLFGMINAG